MRKIIMFNMVSVNGMFAGPNGDLSWHNVDHEFNKFAIEQLNECDTLIFGRVTYKMFEQFWPAAVKNPQTAPDDVAVGKFIDDVHKIVFSKTEEAVAWNNSELHTEIDPKEIEKWKQAKGKNMCILGSGTIVQQLSNLGLIDEYRLMVNPVILSEGRLLFENVDQMKLDLIKIRQFSSGNVLLTYER